MISKVISSLTIYCYVKKIRLQITFLLIEINNISGEGGMMMMVGWWWWWWPRWSEEMIVVVAMAVKQWWGKRHTKRGGWGVHGGGVSGKRSRFDSFCWSLAKIGVKKLNKRRRYKIYGGHSRGMLRGSGVNFIKIRGWKMKMKKLQKKEKIERW